MFNEKEEEEWLFCLSLEVGPGLLLFLTVEVTELMLDSLDDRESTNGDRIRLRPKEWKERTVDRKSVERWMISFSLSFLVTSFKSSFNDFSYNPLHDDEHWNGEKANVCGVLMSGKMGTTTWGSMWRRVDFKSWYEFDEKSFPIWPYILWLDPWLPWIKVSLIGTSEKCVTWGKGESEMYETTQWSVEWRSIQIL